MEQADARSSDANPNGLIAWNIFEAVPTPGRYEDAVSLQNGARLRRVHDTILLIAWRHELSANRSFGTAACSTGARHRNSV
jgi:hypothetical protein